jgi:hypothetical protein
MWLPLATEDRNLARDPSPCRVRHLPLEVSERAGVFFFYGETYSLDFLWEELR